MRGRLSFSSVFNKFLSFQLPPNFLSVRAHQGRSAFQQVSSHTVLVHGVIPPQMQDYAVTFAELHDVLLCPSLQPSLLCTKQPHVFPLPSHDIGHALRTSFHPHSSPPVLLQLARTLSLVLSQTECLLVLLMDRPFFIWLGGRTFPQVHQDAVCLFCNHVMLLTHNLFVIH